MSDEAIRAKFASDYERLKDYGGLGQRTDLEEYLGIGSNDYMQGLKDYVRKHGYKGLPAVVGGAAIPVIRGNGSSADEP